MGKKLKLDVAMSLFIATVKKNYKINNNVNVYKKDSQYTNLFQQKKHEK